MTDTGFSYPKTYVAFGRLSARRYCRVLRRKPFDSLPQAEHYIRRYITNLTGGEVRLERRTSALGSFINFYDVNSGNLHGYIREI